MNASSGLTASTHITQTPGVCGGKPCVANTRIRVQDVYVWYEFHGRSADEIVGAYPQLTHADVHAALAWFWDHRDTILNDMKAAGELAQAMRSRFPVKTATGSVPS